MGRELLLAAHMYQPEREVGRELSVVPFVNEQIYKEVYRPILVEGDRLPDGMVFSYYLTLREWVRRNHRMDFARIWQKIESLPDKEYRVLGDPFFHDILPLLGEDDMDILLAAGREAFRADFGFVPKGLWLPEMAVDTRTLEAAVRAGYVYTVLMADQFRELNSGIVRVDLPNGEVMRVIAADPGWSRGVAYEDGKTTNGDRFLDWVQAAQGDVVLATDGETFGHHKKMREWFLRYTFDREVMRKHGVSPMDVAARVNNGVGSGKIWERSAWSCVHGLGRWTGECDCDSPSEQALADKRKYYGELMRILGVARVAMQKNSPRTYKQELVRMLVENRTTMFGETGFGNWPTRGGDGGRLMTAYAVALTGLTSCGWFFGGPGRPERLIPEWAIQKAGQLLT